MLDVRLHKGKSSSLACHSKAYNFNINMYVVEQAKQKKKVKNQMINEILNQVLT